MGRFVQSNIDVNYFFAACIVAVFALSQPLFAQSTATANSLQGMKWLEKATYLEDDAHQYSEAIALYRKCLVLFKKCGYQDGYFKAQIGIAYSFSENSQHDEAKSQITNTIQELEALPTQKRPIKKLGDAWLAKGSIHKELLEIEPAVASYEKALSIYQQLPGTEREKGMAAAYHNLGSLYVRSQNFPKAMEALGHALELKKKVFGPSAPSTLGTIGLQADTWLLMGNLNKALELQQTIVRIATAANDEEGLASSYREISKIYQRKKDYKTAEEYIRKAIEIYGKNPERNLQNEAFCEHQMGNVVKDGGRYAESIHWFESAIEKQDKIGDIPNLHSAISTVNIAKAHNYLMNYPMALKVYQQAWDMFDKTLPKDHPRYVELWLSIGASYYDNNDLKAAGKYYLMAYNLAKKVLPEKSFDRAQTCFYLTQTTEDFLKALSLCQEGLQRISTDFVSKTLFDNPPIENIYQEQVGLRLFQQKIAILARAYDETCDKLYLEKALETTLVASDLVDLLRQSFFTESAKTYLGEKARKIYEAGVLVAFHLQEIQLNPVYLEQAFELMEKSRSLILLEELHNATASQLVKIPDSLAFQREFLKKEILLLETQFQLAGNDMEKTQKINEQLFATKGKYNDLEKYFGQYFPEISKLMKNMEAIKLPDVQAKLKNGEVILEYLVAENDLFLLKITKDKAELSNTPLPQNFQAQITDFVQSIKDPVLAANAGMGLGVYLDFTKKSRVIYELLIGRQLNGTEKNILIIPDLWLSYLPFEILLTNDGFSTEKVDYSTLPYLFRTYPVRYAFSANLQFDRSANTKFQNAKVLAYAPAYQGDSNTRSGANGSFPKLTQTTTEVAEIQSLMGGTKQTGQLASEKNFKAEAPDYGILHLAMHAQTDEENPMVSGLIYTETTDGEDGILHTYELMGMKLNAQLAVLSACNTGSGKLATGEGVMSLARAFRHAGCPNIVMSLWQADDEATGKIMLGFYAALKKGLPKDVALQQAKLNYLASNRKTFPYYWSEFVLLGDNEPIEFPNNSSWFWGLGIIGLLGLLWFAKKQTKVRR
ncbi:MAG: CHAT domain-containing protein [Saprospiraceae bacterium]|nr:CHAT domain-containing protein [Saprospiraceae bacterium]MCF8249820.1 CHAT domain-containing protein [Saprospiraceae bacterium]MCF8283263.1 CHAT domain-containing protein [Bacteroidales bacterium]MCF8311746.1 CHAT domain-containing protein [Saprospiraceae bacterium]MCF8440313.1 CHAT domain-containing protein [Saprospiraceae bacterium]